MASKVRPRTAVQSAVKLPRQARDEGCCRCASVLTGCGQAQVLTYVLLDVSASMHRALDYARRSLTVFLTSKVIASFVIARSTLLAYSVRDRLTRTLHIRARRWARGRRTRWRSSSTGRQARTALTWRAFLSRWRCAAEQHAHSSQTPRTSSTTPSQRRRCTSWCGPPATERVCGTLCGLPGTRS